MNKSSRQVNSRRPTRRRRRSVQYLVIVSVCLITILSLAQVWGPIGELVGARRLTASLFSAQPPAPFPSANNPSKEYVYLGGKLIATEEPGGGSSLAAPLGLVATTTWTPPPVTPQVQITWSASPGAHHYQVERTYQLNKPFTILSSNVLTTSFTDTPGGGVVGAFVYQVRAVDAFGNVSPPSNLDIATAITFTDDPLVANSTVIKGQHVKELRQAVNAMLQTALMPLPFWTDDFASLSGIQVKAIHIEELRSNLNTALSGIGVPLSPYTDPVLSGVHIKKVHLDELRERVR